MDELQYYDQCLYLCEVYSGHGDLGQDVGINDVMTKSRCSQCFEFLDREVAGTRFRSGLLIPCR